ncbi:MAG: hypothetical protein ACE5LU_08725 [Anaerolineae bacterium]
MQRTIGTVMLVIGVIGVLLSLAGIFIGRRVIDQVGANLEQTLSLTSRSLDNVEATLVQTRATMEDVNTGLGTVVVTIVDTNQTVEATGPLLDQASLMVVEDIPQGIDAVQAIVPSVAQTAKSIDTALRDLRDFTVNILGIDLDAMPPLDQPINEIGAVLGDLSGKLRGLENDLNRTVRAVETTNQDIRTVSGDLTTLNDDLAGFIPIVDEYIDIIKETNNTVRQTQAGTGSQLGTLKLGITIIMLWIGLTHIVPLYLGWELVTGRRNAGLVEG